MKKILAALALVASSCAQAQLEVRDSSFGAGTHVYDSFSGLTWLRLDYSTGLTAQDWQAAADARQWSFSSGAYAGYSLASMGQVTELVERNVCADTPSCGGLRWSDGPHLTDASVTDRAFDLISLFGGTTTTADGTITSMMRGTAASDSGFGFPTYDIWLRAQDGPGGTYTDTDRWGVGATVDRTVYLIAPAVPEPSTYALMLAGLATLLIRRARSRGSPLPRTSAPGTARATGVAHGGT